MPILAANMGSDVDAAKEEIRPSRLQLLVFAREEIRSLDLPPIGTMSIGRAEGSAVRIDDLSVSRNHAILHVGTKLTIEDLGSANGTMVRDRAGVGAPGETLNVRHLVGRTAELVVGDTMLFGTASVVVRHAPPVDVPDLGTPGDTFAASDPAMRLVHQQAARAAPTPINVLILGETGVGKEVIARAIHARSTRANGPFMGINCAALSDSLLESELFGHEKGSFTGALQARAGLFEAAEGGTVFLDEVGELSPGTQAKLLRVLEERVVTRLGSNRPRPIDVRILAATNRDPEAEIGTGRFRSDLYFRLNGLSLSIPALRERQGEIEDLARRFLASACRLIERTDIPRISPEVLLLLRVYRWPGNVRELRNVIERAAVLCPGDMILPEHLPPALIKGAESSHPPAVSGGRALTSASDATPGQEAGTPPAVNDLPAEIRSIERARIIDALERCGGSQSKAARMLGVSRGTLISRIEAYGLPRPRKRDVEPGP
jgi:two-component system, NtrC family, response regulator AtoC